MSAGSLLRTGVVGLGRRGTEHIETLGCLTDYFQLVAVCDLSESAAQSAAAATGVRGYSSIKAFFDTEKLDVAIIATPRDTHHLIVKMAADRGVHMLIETPLAQTRRMMDAIIEAVARTGVKAEVGEQMYRRPPDSLTRKVLDAGLIGKIVRISSYYDDAGDNHCYHTMSRMRVFAGSDVEEIRAHRRIFEGVANRAGAESWTQSILTFANGITGALTYVTDWTLPLRARHPRFMSVEGSEGFVVTGNGSPNMLRRVENGAAVDYPLKIETRRIAEHDVPQRFVYETDPPIEYVNPFGNLVLDHPLSRTGGFDGIGRATELDSLYQAIVTNGEVAYGLARARRDQELSILIAEAARLDHPVPGRTDAETMEERQGHESFQERWGFDPFGDPGW
jgi:predicted dehydrogenase